MPETVVVDARDEYRDFGLAVDELRGDGLKGGSIEPPVGQFDDLERYPRQPETAPRRGQIFGTDRVEVEVDDP